MRPHDTPPSTIRRHDGPDQSVMASSTAPTEDDWEIPQPSTRRWRPHPYIPRSTPFITVKVSMDYRWWTILRTAIDRHQSKMFRPLVSHGYPPPTVTFTPPECGMGNYQRGSMPQNPCQVQVQYANGVCWMFDLQPMTQQVLITYEGPVDGFWRFTPLRRGCDMRCSVGQFYFSVDLRGADHILINIRLDNQWYEMEACITHGGDILSDSIS